MRAEGEILQQQIHPLVVEWKQVAAVSEEKVKWRDDRIRDMETLHHERALLVEDLETTVMVLRLEVGNHQTTLNEREALSRYLDAEVASHKAKGMERDALLVRLEAASRDHETLMRKEIETLTKLFEGL